MANNFYNSNSDDSTEITELAELNEDISNDMIAQLSEQLTQNMNNKTVTPNENDDSTLFEETQSTKPVEEPAAQTEPETNVAETPEPVINEPVQEVTETAAAEKNTAPAGAGFEDNFMKKFKAKQLKKAGKESYDINAAIQNDAPPQEGEPIENLSQGNITERPLTKELKEYNDSLDFLDGNVKYSKYVIYIDPKNVDFIDSLTVKERKNLINEILHEQNDIALTKKRFKFMQSVIRHVVVAILTLSITIPMVYYAINASLEATIDNHRRSQTNWQVLYKEHGKITPH